MKLCTYCDTNLPDDAISCIECGASLTSIPTLAATQADAPTQLSTEHVALLLVEEREDEDAGAWHAQISLAESEELPIVKAPVPDPITPLPELAFDIDDLPMPTDASADPELNETVITQNPTIQDEPAPGMAPTPEEEITTGDLAQEHLPADVPISDEEIITDDPVPALNGYDADEEVSATMPVMTFVEGEEKGERRAGPAATIPAPLYPDYGKANGASPAVPEPLFADSVALIDDDDITARNARETPEPLYPDYEPGSTQAAFTRTSTLTRFPNIRNAYPQLWTKRGLAALLLCLLLVVGSTIGVVSAIHNANRTNGTPTPVISALPAKLNVITQTVSSNAIKGSRAILSLQIANSGGQPLHWSGSVTGAPWLTLQKQQDTIQPGAPSQFVYMTANTTSLAVGAHPASVQLTSNGGNSSVPVTLNVKDSGGKKTPLLNVNPNFLAFGTLQQNQQFTKQVSISNDGTKDLAWKSTPSDQWVTLSPASGTIKASGFPQLLSITVNSTGLSTGQHSASVTINSNGGNQSVGINFAVSDSTNNSVLSIAVNPSSFTNGCLVCTVMLTALQSTSGEPTSVQWSASSSGIAGVSFNPTQGTIQAGSAMPVTVTVPNASCPASANFTFSGGASPVSVLWSCTPPLPPSPTVQPPSPTTPPGPTPTIPTTPTVPPSPTTPTSSPLTLSENVSSFAADDNNCPWNGNGWTCTQTITASSGSGSLNWYTGSDLPNASFSPSQGTLNAGQPATVTIYIPGSDCTNGTFTFQGPTNSVLANWNCTQPSAQISVNPSSLTFSNEAANSNASQQVTISNNGSQTLSWSVISGSNWLTVDTSNGSVNGGGSQTINANVNTSGLNAGQTYSGTLSFSSNGGSVTLGVTLTLAFNPAVLSVNPNSINANNSCTWAPGSNVGIWTCSVTLSNAQNASSSLTWTPNSSGFGSANMSASFSPNGDTIAPGGQENVTVTIATGSVDSSCWSQGFSATLIFQGPNTINVPWSCTAPYYVASPSSINGDTDCQHTDGNPWVCNVTLTQQSQGYTNFSTAQGNSNGANATFNPCCGQTFGPGQTQTVQITVNVTGSCPASEDLQFLSTPTITVHWSCSVGTGTPTYGANSQIPSQVDAWIRKRR